MTRKPENSHTLSILVEDRYGELARVVGLFSGRGYNIDALTVNNCLEPGMSRIVLTTHGDDAVVEQIVKQVFKLVRVHEVQRLVPGTHFERELCVATVRAAEPAARAQLQAVVQLTGARVLSFTEVAFTLETTGTSREVDHWLELLQPLGILDMVRSAPIALVHPGAAVALALNKSVAAAE
jgi:acetolactate synthase I/III small subunit